MTQLNYGSFIKGMGVGLVVGASACCMMNPKMQKSFMKSKAGRAIQAVGDVIDNITDMWS